MEVDEKADEGGALLEGAGVLGFAVGIETTFVADADGAAVEGTAVSAHLGKAAVLRYGAITADVEVVANVDEPSGEMVAL